MISQRIRQTYDLAGIVQGVGFRPSVVRLAVSTGLAGWVQNRTDCVRIAVEGTFEKVEGFIPALRRNLPPSAEIKEILLVDNRTIPEAEQLNKFSILPSVQTGSTALMIPADLSMCRDCLTEIMNPRDRRFNYPFTTCVNCGPRYTIVNSTPYDRERTTMSSFPMCKKCRKEYENPEDRRFHAETIACPECGPSLTLEYSRGNTVNEQVIERARLELANGKIIAVRGIGGFLLAADAFNLQALETLRRRKNRPHKPFAVMAPSADTLRKYCILPPRAEDLLKSPEAPIVILDIKPETQTEGRLPLYLITPDAATIGAMLPNSPLQQLLFGPAGDSGDPAFELLVMTSGNRGGEPICITNSEARERLGDIADCLLLHNREINLRNDDSLCIIQRGHPQIWRRSRGYAPNPIHLRSKIRGTVIAMGSDMKNTITLAYDDCAVTSPHIGDLETPEALDSFESVANSLPQFLKREPRLVAVDMHPDMHSTILGRQIAGRTGLPVTEIQHHHAHAAACLEENCLDHGLCRTDGKIWGAELFHVDGSSVRRLSTFSGVPLPGGDVAVRYPARQLVARFINCGSRIPGEWIHRLGISEAELYAWTSQCREGINAPVTHAAGRLFDSFSVLLGLAPARITYEGQPAIRLESAARKFHGKAPPAFPFSQCEHDGILLIDWKPAFAMLSNMNVFRGRETEYAMAAHCSVRDAALKMAEYGLNMTHERTIALSGGVFMNRILNELLVPEITAMGIKVVTHEVTPPNDGCISFGQAVIAGR